MKYKAKFLIYIKKNVFKIATVLIGKYRILLFNVYYCVIFFFFTDNWYSADDDFPVCGNTTGTG